MNCHFIIYVSLNEIFRDKYLDIFVLFELYDNQFKYLKMNVQLLEYKG